jgi:hypothetical protein
MHFFLFRTCSHKTRTDSTTLICRKFDQRRFNHEDLFFIFVEIIVTKYLGSLGALKVHAKILYKLDLNFTTTNSLGL